MLALYVCPFSTKRCGSGNPPRWQPVSSPSCGRFLAVLCFMLMAKFREHSITHSSTTMTLACFQLKGVSLRCTCGEAAPMQSRRAPVFSCPAFRQSVISASAAAAVAVNAGKAQNVVYRPKQIAGLTAARRARCMKVPFQQLDLLWYPTSRVVLLSKTNDAQLYAEESHGCITSQLASHRVRNLCTRL